MSRLDGLLARLDDLRRRVAGLHFDALVMVGASVSDQPDSDSETPVVDAIFSLDDRRGLELTGEEVDQIADVGLDAFDRGLLGADLEAVVAAAVDQVVAARGA